MLFSIALSLDLIWGFIRSRAEKKMKRKSARPKIVVIHLEASEDINMFFSFAVFSVRSLMLLIIKMPNNIFISGINVEPLRLLLIL